jgi:predicted CoA-binding protein
MSEKGAREMNVAVLGASAKKDRYSYKAVEMLKAHGYAVFPVHPALSEVQGMRVFARLSDIDAPLHTISVYLGSERSSRLRDEILQAKPTRVIFNPGAENPALAADLRQNGIRVQEACTLVLLSTGQFEREAVQSNL